MTTMTFFRRFLKRDRAAAVVEFALVVPLFVVLVTGIIMWWRARKWRGDLADRRTARAVAA